MIVLNHPEEKFAEYLKEAVMNCFKTQANTEIKLTGTERAKVHGDLVTSLGLSSAEASGSISLVFPESSYLKIVNEMLGESEKCITASNSDAASELLNIVYGLARPRINAHGFQFQPAIPTVVFGKQLSLGDQKPGEYRYFEATSNAGSFYVISAFEVKE